MSMKSTCAISRRFALCSSAMKRDSTGWAQPSLAYSFAASGGTPRSAVDEQFRVADDVDEQDIPDLEFYVGRMLGRHESHFAFSSQSFWKAGSLRKGSQMGSSLRRAGVIGAM